MKRWKHRLAGLLMGSAALAGCKQPLFIAECDYNRCAIPNLPTAFETDPHAAITPGPADIPAPSTTQDPDRPPRYISLAECIAIALEQGNVGTPNPAFITLTSGNVVNVYGDTLVSFTGGPINQSDSIRVLALDPAITGANIEASLAKFDARWISSMTWNKTDNAAANFQANFQNGDNATLTSGVFKPLPTGGVAGITFNTSYTFLTQPPRGQVFGNVVNPAYRPSVQLQFEQPLWRFYGIDINQLYGVHPGSVLTGGLNGSTSNRGAVEGILLTRLRFDQSRAEFERQVNLMLANVEIAYWGLYNSYYQLYAQEQALRSAFATYRINKARFEAGRIPIQDFAQTQVQLEQFRSQRLTALGQVLESERQLRGLLGLPGSDGTRLVPTDAPVLAPYQPDWATALRETLANRPELILARQDLKSRQLDLILQKDAMRPDLRFLATYDVNGLGTRLDGAPAADPNFPNGNALASLTDNKFNNWQLGLRMNVPLGTREAHAAVRVGRLNLARSYAQLQDQERKAHLLLEITYRRLFEFYTQIELNRNAVDASIRQLTARENEYKAGRGTLDVLLEAQRTFAQSLAAQYQAVANYNQALAVFQWSKGTIMQYDSVVIAEGPLPACAQVRAVEHQRERTAALVLR
jgi:outer membrane protein TolC